MLHRFTRVVCREFFNRMNCGDRGSSAILLLVIYGFVCTGPAFAADVALAWDPPSGVSVAGYKVYYGTASHSHETPVDAGNSTTYTLTGLSAGTYYLAVTSYDALGNESGFSNEISVLTSELPCIYSISSINQLFASQAGTGTVSVTATTGCGWTASSDASWVVITSGSADSGSGTVQYSVTANTGLTSRTASLTVAGQTFTVMQTPLSQSSFCDISGDGAVNVLDLQRLVNIILGKTSSTANGDVNRDGEIDVLDLQLLTNVILGIRGCP